VYYTTNGNDPTTSSNYVDSSDGRQQTFSNQGTFTIKYRAEDRAGNLQAVQTASNQLQIDTQDPTVTASIDGNEIEHTDTV
jgi:hypothetical protein